MSKGRTYHLTGRMVKAVLPFFLAILSPLTAGAHTLAADSVGKDSVTHLQDIPKMLDDKLIANYYKTKYDTNYIARPHQKWLFRFLVNHTGNVIKAQGTVNGIFSDQDFHSNGNTALSLEVNYCDVGASLSFTPNKHDDRVFNFEYYGQRFSLTFNYQRATSLKGNIIMDKITHSGDNGLLMKVYNVTGYYTFNHRRFSFPAALSQNYYQRRSVGSWLAGVTVQVGSVKTTDDLKRRFPQVPETKLTFTNIGIGGGYGYNWVLGNRSEWLLHCSALPALVVYKKHKLTINQQKEKDKKVNFNMLLNGRVAVVYHFTPRYNAGATFITNASLFNDDQVVVKESKWQTRFFFGLRL